MNRKEALQATKDVDFFGINDKHKEELSKALINKIYDDLEGTCKNCKKSIKTYNYMKKFIGYSCKDRLFKDNVNPFPKGFGCNKWRES